MDWRPAGVVRVRRTGRHPPRCRGVETVAHATFISGSGPGRSGGKMMARRSTGKTRMARALWYARKGVAELRAGAPAAAAARARRWCARCSAASAAARSVWCSRGLSAGASGSACAAPMQEGAFSFPGQIRLLRDRSCRGGAGRADGPHRVLPASAPGLSSTCRSPLWCRFPTACRRAGRRSPPTWRRRSMRCGTAAPGPATASWWWAPAWWGCWWRRWRRGCRAPR